MQIPRVKSIQDLDNLTGKVHLHTH